MFSLLAIVTCNFTLCGATLSILRLGVQYWQDFTTMSYEDGAEIHNLFRMKIDCQSDHGTYCKTP